MSEILKYFRENRLPHIWCPGCGHGTITGALVRAIARLKLDKNSRVLVINTETATDPSSYEAIVGFSPERIAR